MLIAAGTLFSSFCASAPTVYAGRTTSVNNTGPQTFSFIPVSHQKAAAAGIDIYGAIPEDYTHKNGSTYHFEEGSNASTWARAQIDITRDSIPRDAQKRWIFSNVGIGMWAGYDCNKGNGYWVDNVAYGSHYWPNTWPQEYVSIGIGYRGLIDGFEHLDFSQPSSESNACGVYRYSAGSVPQTECWNSEPVTCFRLWILHWG